METRMCSKEICDGFCTMEKDNCKYNTFAVNCARFEPMQLFKGQWIRIKNIINGYDEFPQTCKDLGGQYFEIKGFCNEGCCIVGEDIHVFPEVIDPITAKHRLIPGKQQVTGEELYNDDFSENVVGPFIEEFGFYKKPDFGKLLQWAEKMDLLDHLIQEKYIDGIKTFHVVQNSLEKRGPHDIQFRLHKCSDGSVMLFVNDTTIMEFVPGKNPNLYRVQLTDGMPFEFDEKCRIKFE